MIVDTGKSKLCRVGQQSGNLEKSYDAVSGPKAIERQKVFPGGLQSAFLLRPSTDCMRSIHVMEGNLLYAKSTDLNVISSKIYILKKNLHSNIHTGVQTNICILLPSKFGT